MRAGIEFVNEWQASQMPRSINAKKEELEALKQLDQRGEIDLRYLDETGFCLMGYVPYG